MNNAYNIIQRQKGLYSRVDSSSIWSQLWKVKAPPKTLNLLWRALSECLPTKVQLPRKHVQVDTRCPVCLDGDESILHSLVSCSSSSILEIGYAIIVRHMIETSTAGQIVCSVVVDIINMQRQPQSVGQSCKQGITQFGIENVHMHILLLLLKVVPFTMETKPKISLQMLCPKHLGKGMEL